MGLKGLLAARKAAKLQSQGNVKEAMAAYEEAMNKGLDDMRFILAYAVLLIRNDEYQKAKELLVAKQKLPMNPEQKSQLFMDYAVCCYKLGDIDRGIRLIEEQHRRQARGLLYETLGYLYVEKYCMENKPSLEAAEDAAQAADGEDAAARESELSPEEAWNQGVDKALAFLKEAVDYDEDDAICMDNMAQFYYRVQGDKAEAKTWFDKALALKDNQIDTLWFLSRYDLEQGDTAAAIDKLETALDGRFSPLNYATKASISKELARLKGEA